MAYGPNPPGGPFTVHAQQNLFFHSKNVNLCPKKVFLSDLCDLIKEFIDSGDNIILLIDANTNLKRSDLQQALKDLLLNEAIMGRHVLQGPSTFH
jgi:hypothetical protein